MTTRSVGARLRYAYDRDLGLRDTHIVRNVWRYFGRRSVVVALGIFALVIAFIASVSACGSDDSAPPTPMIARTPAQAVSLYNRAILSGDWAMLTRFGRLHAISEGREKAGAGTRGPSGCPAALEQVVVDTGSYRKLNRARVVRVRADPEGDRDQVVTQRFPDGLQLDILVRPRGRGWLVVVNPYSPFG